MRFFDLLFLVLCIGTGNALERFIADNCDEDNLPEPPKPPKPYPDYAVDYPVLFGRRQNADSAERYFKPGSPFSFVRGKPHLWIKWQTVPHVDRRLARFRVDEFLQFLLVNPPTMREERVLDAAIRAWVLCPAEITLAQQEGRGPTSSNDFVHAAMALQLVKEFSACADSARLRQIQANGPNWTGAEFLSAETIQNFEFDLVFLLGGLGRVITLATEAQHQLDKQSQLIPVLSVVCVMHELHKRLLEKRTNRKIRLWGVNKAREIASQRLIEAGHRTRTSPDTIRNHWEALQLSAALIYAAVLTDESMLLPWLFGNDNIYAREYPGRYFHAWYRNANAVMRELLQPLGLRHHQWSDLKVAGQSDLPQHLGEKDLEAILTANFYDPALMSPSIGDFVITSEGDRYKVQSSTPRVYYRGHTIEAIGAIRGLR